MAEKTCPDCAEQVQQAARVCKHCGYRFDEAPASGQTPPPQGGSISRPYTPPTVERANPREHPEGTTVLVLGILGLVLCGILAPFAWVRGSKAVKEIDAAPPGSYTNRGSAQAGKVMGIVGTVIWISAIVLYVVLAVGIFAGGSTRDRAENNACETDTKTIKTSIAAWNVEYLGGNPAYPTAYPTSMEDLVDGGLLTVESSLHTISGSGSTAPTIRKVSGECGGEEITQFD